MERTAQGMKRAFKIAGVEPDRPLGNAGAVRGRQARSRCAGRCLNSTGTIEVEGVSAPVRIVRDREGVPHITAQSRNDALFGLGFVHGQDRLWQMEFQRRTIQGRLERGCRVRRADRRYLFAHARTLSRGRTSAGAIVARCALGAGGLCGGRERRASEERQAAAAGVFHAGCRCRNRGGPPTRSRC